MIAFFDLDGTITSKDTFIEFIKYCRGKAFYFFGLVALSPAIIAFYLKLYPNYKLKELFFSFYLKKFKVQKLKQLGDEFCKLKMPNITNKAAIERIHWHLKKNHEVIILTASSPIWLWYWCKNIGVKIIGTEFEVNNGNFTGKIDGKNCYGEQKKIIVEQMLNNNAYKETYGYGNSKGDLPFLKLLNNRYYGEIIDLKSLEKLKI